MKDVQFANIEIGGARQEELPDILALLEECGLPKEGLAPHLSTTLVARDGNQIVGSSALEIYEESALLRSVAVKPSFRGQGLARRLSRAGLDLAKHHQVTAVYLLTETASPFFTKLGFKPIPRSDVPEKIQHSVEFTTLCPDTATVMEMSLIQQR
jgi:N-acetylglutamate synthase-like GNAT family acetyltransferase